MKKKLTLLCLCLALITGLNAQDNNKKYAPAKPGRGIYNHHNNAKDVDFDVNDIEFWCGTGSSQAMVIVAWDDIDDPVALVWGVRFDGSNAVVLDLIDSIATYDSRFSYEYSGSLISNVEYNDSAMSLSSEYNYWCYYKNGDWGQSAYGNEPTTNGDVIEMSGSCLFGMTDAVAATNPNSNPPVPTVPDTVAIDSADILYWAGAENGAHWAVVSVCWAERCLAWGVRFDEDSISLQSAMDAIACSDFRFSYSAGNWGVADILFNDYAGNSMALSEVPAGYNYWWCNLNGWAAPTGYDALMLSDGDFVKWGDAAAGTVVDSAGGYPTQLAWHTPVEPAVIPASGPFCGAAGSEGSTAVAYDDSRILGWATSCTLALGPADIANPQSGAVSYGSADEAVGAVTGNNLAVVSLGDGGMATLSFEYPIADGDGYDFAVFENAFNDSFLELAFVEVSTDGERFVRFPATSLTGSCRQIGPEGSIDPSYIDNLAGKYRSGFGTPFDLAQLRDSAGINLDSIMFVRIVDVVGTNDPQHATYDQYGNIVMDPYPTDTYSGGFDLDGVAVLNWNYSEPQGVEKAVADNVRLCPNPADGHVVCYSDVDGQHQVSLYTATGQLLLRQSFCGQQATIGTGHLADGIYVLRLDGKALRLVVKH